MSAKEGKWCRCAPVTCQVGAGGQGEGRLPQRRARCSAEGGQGAGAGQQQRGPLQLQAHLGAGTGAVRWDQGASEHVDQEVPSAGSGRRVLKGD